MPVLKITYASLSIFVLCAIVGLGIITLRYNKTYKDTSNWVHHTINVLDETQKSMAGLHSLQTGNPRTQVLSHLQELRRLTADNALQQSRVDSLFRFYGQAAMAAPLSLLSLAAISSYQDSLREVLLRMQSEEHRLMDIRQAANASSLHILQRTITALLLIIFGLLCISFILILYHLNRRLGAEKKLRDAEQQFTLLVQKERNYAIFMLDTSGNVKTWNEGASRMKGYSADEIIGRPVSLFYTDEQIAQNEHTLNLQTTIEHGQYETVGLRVRKDGSEFWANVVFTAIRNDGGVLTGFVKITRDISEQKKVDEDLRNSLSREKELNEMKSRFVSLASHEFKTPLSVILSSISLIDKYDAPEMSDKRHRHVQRIKSNVNNLRQILNDFLSLEKLEGGLIHNNPVPVDLVKIAEENVSDLEESLKEGQRVILETLGENRLVSVDQHLLSNVLNNLLSNAIKYSPTGSSVRFLIEFYQETVKLIITDTGIGIPEDEQVHLFERFFRAGNTTGVSGTGLGLSIVKKYLDLMGGTIQVSSSPGVGSTFLATIPLGITEENVHPHKSAENINSSHARQ
jgi:two-component system sensor kinase FixL